MLMKKMFKMEIGKWNVFQGYKKTPHGLNLTGRENITDLLYSVTGNNDSSSPSTQYMLSLLITYSNKLRSGLLALT